MSVPFPLYVEVITGGEPLKDLLPGNLFPAFQELLDGTPSGAPVSFIVENEAALEGYAAAILLGAHGMEVSVVDDQGADIHPIEVLRKMPLSENLQKQLEELGLLPLTPSVLSQNGEAENPWFI